MDPPSTPPIPITDEPIHDSLPLITNESPSPSPSLKRSKTRLVDRLETAAEESPEPAGLRRRGKSRATQNIARKARKPRSDVEIREENKDVFGLVEEFGKPRKRKNVGRPKKEKPNLLQSSISSPSMFLYVNLKT